MNYNLIYTERVNNLVQFCIGSDQYKENHKTDFIKIIEVISQDELLMVADYYQLCGIIINETQKYNIKNEKLIYLKNIYEYQKLKSDSVIQLLNEISKVGISNKVPIIILKGPALWDSIYNSNIYLRRISDLDLLFYNAKDIKLFIKEIETIGFNSLEDWYPYIKNNTEYELPPFYRKKLISSIDKKYINFNVRNSIYYNNSNSDIMKYTHQEIEIHKSIFLLKNNKKPSIENCIIECCNFKGFYKLSNSALLVYHSIKFHIDNKLYIENKRIGAKYFKLKCDVIQLLMRSTEKEIENSIDISIRWNVSAIYIEVLKQCANIMPEYNFKF